MIKNILKYKRLISLLLVTIFISPTIVKFEHHHDHFSCNAKNEKHFHAHHEKCFICKFDFSLISLPEKITEPAKPDKNTTVYLCLYFFLKEQNFILDYSLRAPPFIF